MQEQCLETMMKWMKWKSDLVRKILSCIAICYAHERLLQSAVWYLKQRHDLGNLKVLPHAGWHQLSHSPECLWSHYGQWQHGKTPHLIPSLPTNQPGIPLWDNLFMTLLLMTLPWGCLGKWCTKKGLYTHSKKKKKSHKLHGDEQKITYLPN